MNRTPPSRRLGWPDALALGLILVASILIIWHASQRQFLNVGTETDFIGGFYGEATRFLAGEPMQIRFHPPGYPIVLAAMFSFIDDPFMAGLVVTALSAIVVLTTGYLCFRDLGGAAAGLGALAALAGSGVFFSYSTQSTSDVFFLAIWCATLYAAVVAMRTQRAWHWACLGLLISVGILARTNGIVLLLLALAPLVSTRPFGVRLRDMLIVGITFAVPLLLWLAYSSRTGSPFMPTMTYANLALTYFADVDRIGGDARIPLESQFNSSLDVLTRDPLRVLQIYLQDLYRLPKRILLKVTWPPLAFLGAVCSVIWLTRLRDSRTLAILAVTIACTVLMNMKAFEPRYYLLILPVLGASIGLAATWLVERATAGAGESRVRDSSLAGLAIFAFLASGYAGFARAEDPALSAEFAEIIPAVESNTPRDAVLMCRKCNVALHSQRGTVSFPPLETLDQLCTYLGSLDSRHPIYISIAEMERRMRPELSRRLLSDPLPAWLSITSQGHDKGSWRVIRYESHLPCRT